MQSSPYPAITSLLAAQNSEGGWGYRGGGPWAEPTAYALLALGGEPRASGSVIRGARWLAALQRPDGGWPPRASVRQSTWVTALAVLALGERLEASALRSAVLWMLAQSGRESGFWRQLRLRLLGTQSDQDNRAEGWPWYPGTAAWVAPTALTILAMEKAGRRIALPQLEERLQAGRQFLWSTMCRDGGWNHGSNNALGYDSDSYPETTGLALLALHSTTTPKLRVALGAAERHLPACRSLEGTSWLRLGLLAHSSIVSGVHPTSLRSRGVIDDALSLLAARALEGTNRFLE